MKTANPPTPDVAALFGQLLGRTAYINLEERSVLRYESPTPDAANLAKVLAIPADVLWPSPNPTGRVVESHSPLVLSARHVAAIPLLADVQRRLPRGRRLWVAIWNDGTVAMTALPRALNGVRFWWLGMMHDAAQCAPQLADYVEKREIEWGRDYVLVRRHSKAAKEARR